MAKDPAFLFYSKDWLEGTAEMTPEEKGIYIDLLAHQHQKGTLPDSTNRLCRLVSLSEQEFLPVWGTIKHKFEAAENNRLVNKKLTEVVTERLTKSRTNRLTACFAVLIRSVAPELRPMIKASFRVDDFKPFSTEIATERLTEWFKLRLKSIEDGNANADIYSIIKQLENTCKVRIGETEKNIFMYLVVEMVRLFVEKNPEYYFDKNADYSACLTIAYHIAEMKKWTKHDVVNGKMPQAIESWKTIIDFIKEDDWFNTRSLSDIGTVKEWQRLVQKMNTVKVAKPKSKNSFV